jgi:hypothetical protein
MASDTIQVNWRASYCSQIIINLTHCKNMMNNFARAVAIHGIAVLILYISCTYIFPTNHTSTGYACKLLLLWQVSANNNNSHVQGDC